MRLSVWQSITAIPMSCASKQTIYSGCYRRMPLGVAELQAPELRHQEDLAGDLQEREGNYEKAIALFLKSGMAARAASVVAKHSVSNIVWLTSRGC